MNRVLHLTALSIAFIGLATFAHAQVNVTSDGTPIMGVLSTTDPNYGYSTIGQPNVRGTVNSATDMTDGNLATYADTEYDGTLSYPLTQNLGNAYAGLTGLGTVSATEAITSIQLTFELDLYGSTSSPGVPIPGSGIGGFFGDNGTGDYTIAGNGDYLLSVPSTGNYFQVQITTNGTTWTTVAATSNYYQVINGFDVGNGATSMVGPTATFTLADPADGLNIEGIRVAGEVAGPRDGGILGVAEMVVDAPEPSPYALLGLGMAVLFVLARFFRRTSAA